MTGSTPFSIEETENFKRSFKKLAKIQGWTFHKLELKISKGASGQIRLMYLVNTTACVIRLVWIYSHEQFAKLPADKDLKSFIKEILDC
ncbi:MAG: hypothetical protein LDL41_04740 [Coleofasciculus sp. S288]|nr:hypothetical protein [Coleofasciculus sp. S288]